MAQLLISYDLDKPHRNYPGLRAVIQELGGSEGYAWPLESVCIVRTTVAASEVRRRLRATMDAGDRLLVIAVDFPFEAEHLRGSTEDRIRAWLEGA